ncbi:MarR family winged helix-turn-helix transcriptional regulator [Alteribacillus persepolensis]|nr:MarR family transcriptional regulator [Alteribacillus persepolensis]
MDEYKQVFLESIDAIENISKHLQPKMPLLSELQLTTRQESIMILFIRQENITMSEMAERLGISKSAVSQAMNKLEKEDLLIRSINENNRREITMRLGETGIELKRQFQAFERSIIQDYIAQLPLEDIKKVRDVIVALDRIIQQGETTKDV